jgi:hypothetical protein
VIRQPIDALVSRMEEYRGRPFWRMVQLFVARIFRGGGDSDSEGLDLGIGLVLTLLAIPGGFVSILLLNKYGTFLQWLRGAPNVDPLLVALPDEYFFIVLSMTVTGAVAVWRWDAIFPDRRDYMNLVPLPISTGSIFFANLAAVLFLVGLIAFDVNAASCILFPMVVGATQSKFVFFVKFALVHAAGVLLASVFAFFAVFSVIGVLMAVLPPRALRRFSVYIRGVVVVCLVALLCTSFAIPALLRRVPAPRWTLLVPSCWFLGLCQSLRGRAGPTLRELSGWALPGLATVAGLALGAYAVSYHRHFVRIAETADTSASLLGRGPRRVGVLLERLALRTPFQKGCFQFVCKTLLRSETHRLVLTAVGGLGLVLASQALLDGFENAKSWREAALSPGALSIPFILSFLIIVGLRVVFEIPAELRSNWIFQLMIDPDRQESGRLARRVILILVLPWLVAIAFPAYAYLEGWTVACLHTLLVVTWAVLLTNIVLIRFRKIPFTCTLPLFQQHSFVTLLSCCFGFLLYAGSTPEFESSALAEPLRMLSFAPVAVLGWYIPHYFAKSATAMERKLIYEEAPTQTIEALRLSD